MRIKDKKMPGIGNDVVATTQPQFNHIHHVNHKHSLAVIKTRELYNQFFWSKNIKIIILLHLPWSFLIAALILPNSSARFPYFCHSLFIFFSFFYHVRSSGGCRGVIIQEGSSFQVCFMFISGKYWRVCWDTDGDGIVFIGILDTVTWPFFVVMSRFPLIDASCVLLLLTLNAFCQGN